MERDYGKEIDGIQAQLDEIKGLLTAFTHEPQAKTGKGLSSSVQSTGDEQPGKPLTDLLEALCEKADNEGTTGFITYFGTFQSESCQSKWMNSQVNTDKLLAVNEYTVASKVLAGIADNDRLKMLTILLRTPKTAAQLMDECSFATTGQVYHHLMVLLSADLIKKDEHNRGYYIIQPHRVQGIIMTLAGISDMLRDVLG